MDATFIMDTTNALLLTFLTATQHHSVDLVWGAYIPTILLHTSDRFFERKCSAEKMIHPKK